MVTMMTIGWDWIGVRLLREGMKTASTRGCKTLLLLIPPMRSQVGRLLCATTFSKVPFRFLPHLCKRRTYRIASHSTPELRPVPCFNSSGLYPGPELSLTCPAAPLPGFGIAPRGALTFCLTPRSRRYNLARGSVINPRKLAAIDITFLGSRFIIAEFAGGVLLCLALGTFVLFRAASFWQFALGVYLISLGVNYVPMLIYAVAITRGRSARAEMADELNDKRRAMAKYRRYSIILLIPLLVPIVALRQRRSKA